MNKILQTKRRFLKEFAFANNVRIAKIVQVMSKLLKKRTISVAQMKNDNVITQLFLLKQAESGLWS